MSSEERYIDYAKRRYIEKLIANGDLVSAQKKSKLALYEPLLEQRFMHPEDEPSLKNYNENLVETMNDIAILSMELQSSSLDYERLAANIISRLEEVKSKLEIQRDLQQDISMLCNAYSCFKNVVPLTDHVESGNASYINEMFCAKRKSTTAIKPTITNIEGNGYEGNAYVLDGESFLKEKKDTSNRNHLIDDSKLTVYEYSRLLTDQPLEKTNADRTTIPTDSLPAVNYDNVPAKCMITLKTNLPCNKVTILSEQTAGIMISGIYLSNDNIAYKNVLSEPVLLSKVQNDYINNNYIDKSGMFCFGNAKYITLSLESTSINNNDSIGYIKSVIENKETASTTESTSETEKTSGSSSDSWYSKYEGTANSGYTKTTITEFFSERQSAGDGNFTYSTISVTTDNWNKLVEGYYTAGRE